MREAVRSMTITIRYSCFACEVRKKPLEVPARANESADQWMTQTIQLIAADHWREHPGCQQDSLSELMIPAPPGATKLGGPVEH